MTTPSEPLTETDLDVFKTAEDSAVVAYLARESTRPVSVKPGEIYLVRDADGNVQLVDTDRYAERPRPAQTVQVTMTDAESFVAWVQKYKTPETEIYADLDSASVTAIVDAPKGDGTPGYGFVSSTLVLKASQDWTEWTGIDRDLLEQVEFAEFIEDHLGNIEKPQPAELLGIAQSLRAKKGVDFESSTLLTDGRTALKYVETLTARAGEKGQLTIPDTIKLAVPLFEGSRTGVAVTARFRYRLTGRQLRLGVVIDRPDLVQSTGFDQVVKSVADGTGIPLWAGKAQL